MNRWLMAYARISRDHSMAQGYARQVYWIATVELIIATGVIGYVSLHYYLISPRQPSNN